MSGRVEIKLLDFGEKQKDLYVESMKLINREVDEHQFIRDQMYYSMVRSIYMHEFQRLEADESLFYDGIYQGTVNQNLIGVYVMSAVDVYCKFRDLNKYVGYNFEPLDENLVHYVTTQYINYFFQRQMFENETTSSFYDRMIPYINESKHHPFRRINSDTYGIEEINGENVYLNDLIYKSKKRNREICQTLNISLDTLLKEK